MVNPRHQNVSEFKTPANPIGGIKAGQSR